MRPAGQIRGTNLGKILPKNNSEIKSTVVEYNVSTDPIWCNVKISIYPSPIQVWGSRPLSPVTFSSSSRWNAKVLPGYLWAIVSSACPGVSSWLGMPKVPPSQWATWTPEPPRLAPFNAEKQHLYLNPLSNFRALSPVHKIHKIRASESWVLMEQS